MILIIDPLIGWVANLLLILGAWRLAHRERLGFLLGVAGSALWAFKAIYTQQWDLLTIEVILGSLQLWSWLKWGKSS